MTDQTPDFVAWSRDELAECVRQLRIENVAQGAVICVLQAKIDWLEGRANPPLYYVPEQRLAPNDPLAPPGVTGSNTTTKSPSGGTMQPRGGGTRARLWGFGALLGW